MTETRAANLHEAIAGLIGFDPNDPAFRDDPYPHYARLRERAPIYRSPGGFWVLSRYDDCTAVLRDERFGHPQGADVNTPDALLGGSRDQRHFFLFTNPPDHTRLRSLVREMFTPAVVNGLRPYVGTRVEELLAAADPARFDVIGEFSDPLSLSVICELLCVPVPDRLTLMAWARDFLDGIDPSLALSAERDRARDVAFANLSEYFRDLIEARRRDLGDDLVSRLISAADSTGAMNARELEGTVIVMFIAGHGTTTNLIGNGTLAFIRNPEQRRQYRTDSSVAVSGIEELLRYDSPSQLTVRTALADVELDGHAIRTGDQLVVLRGAANHDPAAFAAPSRLELARQNNRHLSFGHGIHRCVGASLARMEGRIAFRALLERAPDLELAVDRLRYRESLLFRGLTALPVRLR